MKSTHLVIGVLCGLAAAAGSARAGTADINFTGSGVSGSLVVTYGPSTDLKYPQAYEIQMVTGWFTDTNNGLNIVNSAVTGLQPINHATPEPSNTLAPNDFSRFGPIAGLPAVNNGFLTYDNLFWPQGAPQTANDYPFSGGFVDIYGLMFRVGGDVVDLFSWGNNPTPGLGPYGVGVADVDKALDYVAAVNATVPEPSTWALMALGFVGVAFAGSRISPKKAAV